MQSIDIGIAVSIGMVTLIIIGMRVAFAAGIAGLIGLVWIFWAKKEYGLDDFGWAVGIAVKTAGQVPHSKISSQALSLIPIFILIGYLAYYAGLTKALFEAAKRWIAWVPGGLAVATVFRHGWICRRIGRIGCHLCRVCPNRNTRDAGDRL